MIYARVDVNFGDHPKALAAGPVARDLWTWGLLYCRKHELDGHLPTAAVLASSWGAGGRSNRKVADRLVEVGLWATADDGWRILRYAEKNETRAEIDTRRVGARERMAAARGKRSQNVRANKQRTNGEPTSHGDDVFARTNGERSPNVHDQIQESESESDQIPLSPPSGDGGLLVGPQAPELPAPDLVPGRPPEPSEPLAPRTLTPRWRVNQVTDDGHFGMLVEAYNDGLRLGRKAPTTGLRNRIDVQSFLAIVRAHAPAGADLCAWAREAAEQFGSTLPAGGTPTLNTFSGWLDRGRKHVGEGAGLVATRPQPEPIPQPPKFRRQPPVEPRPLPPGAVEELFAGLTDDRPESA